jgi:hypothetical protein
MFDCLTPGKEYLLRVVQSAGCKYDPVWVFWKIRESLASAGNGRPNIQQQLIAAGVS